MKSQTFLKISTLILGASILAGSVEAATPVYADDISASAVDPSLLPVGTEIDGKRYWSVAEMQIASDLISTKREEFCQGDRMCQEELPWQQMDELGGIYRALDPFEHIHFALTAINPSKDTFKVLYHDEDKMLSRMLGETVRYGITSIYAVWVDESLGSITTTSSNWLAYGQRAPYHLGSAEEVEAATHLLFDESENEFGPGWFTPNIEREYHVEGSNLAANTTAQIYFSFIDTAGGHSHGTLNYANCVKSPSYAVGMDCTMMYAEDGSYAYLPFTPASESTTPVEPASIELEIPTQDSSTNPNQPESQTINNPELESPIMSGETIHNNPNPANEKNLQTTTNPTSNSSVPAVSTVSYPVINPPYYADMNTTIQHQNESIPVNTSDDRLSVNSTSKEGKSNEEIHELVEVPLSGSISHDGASFPWWLLVLFIGGSLFILLWFFLPVSHRGENEQEKFYKSEKKY